MARLLVCGAAYYRDGIQAGLRALRADKLFLYRDGSNFAREVRDFGERTGIDVQRVPPTWGPAEVDEVVIFPGGGRFRQIRAKAWLSGVRVTELADKVRSRQDAARTRESGESGRGY